MLNPPRETSEMGLALFTNDADDCTKQALRVERQSVLVMDVDVYNATAGTPA